MMERQVIERQHVTAMMTYVQRCATIVPTIGVEWESLRNVLAALEAVVQGKAVIEVRPVGAQQTGDGETMPRRGNGAANGAEAHPPT